jgi:hypothetical protein
VIKISESFNLDKEEIMKILKGLGLAAAGAMTSFMISYLGGLELNSELMLAVAALASTGLNAVLKWIKNKQKEY